MIHWKHLMFLAILSRNLLFPLFLSAIRAADSNYPSQGVPQGNNNGGNSNNNSGAGADPSNQGDPGQKDMSYRPADQNYQPNSNSMGNPMSFTVDTPKAKDYDKLEADRRAQSYSSSSSSRFAESSSKFSEQSASSRMESSVRMEVVSKIEALSKMDVSSRMEALSKMESSVKAEVMSKMEALSRMDPASRAEAMNRMKSNAKMSASAGYFPSMYDPLVTSKHPDLFRGTKGFIKNHNNKKMKVPQKHLFGSLSLLSFNLYTENDIDLPKITSALANLIDTHHPSIIAFQNIDPDNLKTFEERLAPHYMVVNGEESCRKELRTNDTKCFPIFYDKEILDELSKDLIAIKIRKYHYVFGTYVFLQKKDTGEKFIVTNTDIFSTQTWMIKKVVASAMKAIRLAKNQDIPLLMAMVMEHRDSEIEGKVLNKFKNAVDQDSLTSIKKLSRNTLMNNNFKSKETDMIIYRNGTKHSVGLNSARVLSKFKEDGFHHYPIYMIFHLKKGKDES